MRLSILIPVYNEEEFIATLLKRVLDAPLPNGMERELIVVDDGSSDRSFELAQRVARNHPNIHLLQHARNQGKGAAIRTAVEHATGEFCVIQDSDLELSPNEYPQLLKPLLQGVADVVYGSRFMTGGERRVVNFWHALGNRVLTTACNMFAGLNLTDMETCYKTFRTSLLQSIPIRSDRFGIEPELTIKLAQRHARIYETPISYNSRSYDEGKKIGIFDALEAFYVMATTALAWDIFKDPGAGTLEAFAGASRLNQWLADTIQPHLGQDILEVGAGTGSITRFLVARTHHYLMTDNDPDQLTYLSNRFGHQPNVEVSFAELTRAGCFRPLNCQVDSVVCVNVIEHLEDDVLALQNMRSVLRPGGSLVLVVPCGQELFGAIDKSLGRKRRYSQAAIEEKLETAGFKLSQIIQFNRAGRPGWYFKGRVRGKNAISRRQMRRFDRFVPLWRKIDSWLPWGPTALVAIARCSGSSEPKAAEKP